MFFGNDGQFCHDGNKIQRSGNHYFPSPSHYTFHRISIQVSKTGRHYNYLKQDVTKN